MNQGLSTSSNDLMVVYVANNEPEAYVVAGRLENEGIASFIHQEPVGRAYGLSVGPLGEVKVAVRAADYVRAQAILDEDMSDDALDLYEEDDHDDDYDDE